MKHEWVNIMTKNKRLKLTTAQTLTHYGIVLFLLFIVLMTCWSLIEIYLTKTYKGVLTADELIRTTSPFFVLAIILAVIQYKRLNFKEIKISCTEDEFQKAIELTVSELKWKIDNNNKRFFRATRPWNWTASWGEMITIIKQKDGLLINSICNPDRISSTASYGWNRKNIKTFLENLSNITDNRKDEIGI